MFYHSMRRYGVTDFFSALTGRIGRIGEIGHSSVHSIAPSLRYSPNPVPETKWFGKNA